MLNNFNFPKTNFKQRKVTGMWKMFDTETLRTNSYVITERNYKLVEVREKLSVQVKEAEEREEEKIAERKRKAEENNEEIEDEEISSQPRRRRIVEETPEEIGFEPAVEMPEENEEETQEVVQVSMDTDAVLCGIGIRRDVHVAYRRIMDGRMMDEFLKSLPEELLKFCKSHHLIYANLCLEAVEKSKKTDWVWISNLLYHSGFERNYANNLGKCFKKTKVWEMDFEQILKTAIDFGFFWVIAHKYYACQELFTLSEMAKESSLQGESAFHRLVALWQKPPFELVEPLDELQKSSENFISVSLGENYRSLEEAVKFSERLVQAIQQRIEPKK
jgi:hypothetical protein